ncbi:MAG TPA: sigma-54 factor interaction domain-containing protein, partial [Labilithrix sp.]
MVSSDSHRARVLVLEGDEAAAAQLTAALPEATASWAVADSADAGLEALAREPFDVVLLAGDLGAETRRRLVDAAHLLRPGVQFILLGGGTSDEPSVFERLARPVDAASLEASVKRAVVEHERFVSGPSASESESIVLGSSAPFLATLEAVDRVAHSAAPVLLVGETGTGKDVLAHRIHMQGPRRNRPFVVVNAGAIPSSLLDSELFGHVGGAFTGATRPRRGLIHEADGGTLFLDEIADLPIELQGRLLRVLESGFVRAVGADQERHVDVRFLAATHRELGSAVAAGTFREDLYFRLNVLA